MIKIYPEEEVKQGTQLWLDMRKNYCTGTDCHSLLRGESVENLLAKKKTARGFGGNYYTRRGHLLEDEAKKIYSEVYGPTTNAGFITNDKYPLAGYSPDGLVGEDGLVECKAFQESHHLKCAKAIDAQILAQIQHGLFVSERQWCDLILYNPDMDDPEKAFIVKRVKPIKAIQDKLKDIFKKSPTKSIDSGEKV